MTAATSFPSNRRSNYRLTRGSDHSWQINVDDNLITKNIVDISASGISFKAPASFNLEPGQTLNLTISLLPGDQFECQGRILWSKSEASSSRTMKLFGVKFEQLPAWIDTMIAKELHKEALKSHWTKITLNQEERDNSISLPLLPAAWHWPTLLRQIMTAGLIATFFFAAHIYQKTHPQDSIEYRFNQSLAKKLGHF